MTVEFIPVFLYYCIRLYKEMNNMSEEKTPNQVAPPQPIRRPNEAIPNNGVEPNRQERPPEPPREK